MNRVELWCCLLWCCLIYSCSFIKNKDLQEQEHQSNSQINSQYKVVEKVNIQKSAETKDSNVTSFSALIKPIGRFVYGEKEGFTGLAEYVILSGQTLKHHQASIKETSEKDSKVKQQSQQLLRQKSFEMQAKVSTKRPIPNLFYFLLLAVAGLIYYFRHPILNIFKYRSI